MDGSSDGVFDGAFDDDDVQALSRLRPDNFISTRSSPELDNMLRELAPACSTEARIVTIFHAAADVKFKSSEFEIDGFVKAVPSHTRTADLRAELLAIFNCFKSNSRTWKFVHRYHVIWYGVSCLAFQNVYNEMAYAECADFEPCESSEVLLLGPPPDVLAWAQQPSDYTRNVNRRAGPWIGGLLWCGTLAPTSGSPPGSQPARRRSAGAPSRRKRGTRSCAAKRACACARCVPMSCCDS